MTTLIDTHIAVALSSDYDFPCNLFVDGHIWAKLLKTTQKDYGFVLKSL